MMVTKMVMNDDGVDEDENDDYRVGAVMILLVVVVAVVAGL